MGLFRAPHKLVVLFQRRPDVISGAEISQPRQAERAAEVVRHYPALPRLKPLPKVLHARRVRVLARPVVVGPLACRCPEVVFDGGDGVPERREVTHELEDGVLVVAERVILDDDPVPAVEADDADEARVFGHESNVYADAVPSPQFGITINFICIHYMNLQAGDGILVSGITPELTGAER